MAFSFSEWAEEGELSEEVLNVLQTENLQSKRALVLLYEEDIKELKLKKGDRLLLTAAVISLRGDRANGPLARPDTSRQLLLDDILNNGSGQTRRDTTFTDPAIYLTKGETGSVLKITDYVSCAGSELESEIQLGGGLSLKLPSQKPKLDSVSPAMWMAANGRIMAELLQRGDLQQQDTLDYIAYTVKVGELACRYSWASVLLYDQEYRALQAASGFRWGSDTPHLSTVSLREKATHGTQQQRQGNATTKRRPVAASGKEICLQWNRGYCTFGSRCNFEHSCASCGQNHPSKDHHQGGSAPPSQGTQAPAAPKQQ